MNFLLSINTDFIRVERARNHATRSNEPIFGQIVAKRASAQVRVVYTFTCDVIKFRSRRHPHFFHASHNSLARETPPPLLPRTNPPNLMTDEQKELEELRKYKAEKEMTVEQKELEELREYKAAQEKEQKNENDWGAIILLVLPLWVAAIISCVCLGVITDTRDDIFSLLQRTEDQVKEINSKLPYGCLPNGMIASLYEECPN